VVIVIVKSVADRQDKYAAKFDATVIASRYTATATLAKAKAALMQSALQGVNSSVRAFLSAAGILPIQTVLYQSYGMKLFGICVKFGNYMGVHSIDPTARAQAIIQTKVWTTGYSGSPPVLASIWSTFADILGAAPSPFPT
jgi:hypothetical protein